MLFKGKLRSDCQVTDLNMWSTDQALQLENVFFLADRLNLQKNGLNEL